MNEAMPVGDEITKQMAIKYENHLNETLDKIPDTIEKVQLLIYLIGRVEDEASTLY